MTDATDAVCGAVFEEETAEEMGAFKAVHRGKVHWFCSSTCKETFERDPERYASTGRSN